jgi:hypothetical protein
MKKKERISIKMPRRRKQEHPETDEQAMRLAQRARRAGKSPSTQAGPFVHEEIPIQKVARPSNFSCRTAHEEKSSLKK